MSLIAIELIGAQSNSKSQQKQVAAMHAKAHFFAISFLSGNKMVWIQTEPVVHKYVLDRCDTLHLTESINTFVSPLGLALRNNSQGRTLVNPINIAIAHLILTPGYNNILDKHIRIGTVCETKQASEDQAVTLYNMWGVFIIYGAITFLSFVRTSIRLIWARDFGDTNASCEDDKAVCRSESSERC